MVHVVVVGVKMGKKRNAEASLGRSLIKDRFGANKGRKFVADKSMVSATFFFCWLFLFAFNFTVYRNFFVCSCFL